VSTYPLLSHVVKKYGNSTSIVLAVTRDTSRSLTFLPDNRTFISVHDLPRGKKTMFWKKRTGPTDQTAENHPSATPKTVRVALQIRYESISTVTQDELFSRLLPIFRSQTLQPRSMTSVGTDNCVSVEYILERETRTGFCLECVIEDEIRLPIRSELKNAGFALTETRIEIS
jgi:hypothetical protein